MVYEWDPRKAAANLKKHRVSFREAVTVFQDPFAITFDDPDHSVGERRYITIGTSSKHRVVVVAHADRGEDRIRVVGARPATKTERHAYEETTGT